MTNTTILQQLAQLEANLDDQAELIRKLARGMRFCYHELDKDLPDIDRAKDLLNEHYIGGAGELIKAVKTKARKR